MFAILLVKISLQSSFIGFTELLSQADQDFDFDAHFDYILAPCRFDWCQYAGMPEIDATFSPTREKKLVPADIPCDLTYAISALPSYNSDVEVKTSTITPQEKPLHPVLQHPIIAESALPSPTAGLGMGLPIDTERDIQGQSQKKRRELHQVDTSPTQSTRPKLLDANSICDKIQSSATLVIESQSSVHERSTHGSEECVNPLDFDQSNGQRSIPCRVDGCSKLSHSKRADE